MAGKGTPSKLSLKKKTRPLPEVMVLKLNLIEALKPVLVNPGKDSIEELFFWGPDLDLECENQVGYPA
jgi:hypothetical protein